MSVRVTGLRQSSDAAISAHRVGKDNTPFFGRILLHLLLRFDILNFLDAQEKPLIEEDCRLIKGEC